MTPQDYYSACFRADLSKTTATFNKKGQKRLQRQELHSLRQNFINRFVKCRPAQVRSSDPLVKELISIYHNYYRASLLKTKSKGLCEKQLLKELMSLSLKYALPQAQTIDELSESFIRELKERGYHSLFGRVLPFYSLMIWRHESIKTYNVALPTQKQKVRVAFMKHFLEHSWLSFATFGRYGVGGWAGKKGLYCVKSKYRLASETFRVHYLIHEAQHFADYKHFPKLVQDDLEYRAKLAELAMSKRPKKFYERLALEADSDSTSPHSFAAYHIVQEIDEGLSSTEMNERAHILLRKNTKALRKSGPKTVRTLLR